VVFGWLDANCNFGGDRVNWMLAGGPMLPSAVVPITNDYGLRWPTQRRGVRDRADKRQWRILVRECACRSRAGFRPLRRTLWQYSCAATFRALSEVVVALPPCGLTAFAAGLILSLSVHRFRRRPRPRAAFGRLRRG